MTIKNTFLIILETGFDIETQNSKSFNECDLACLSEPYYQKNFETLFKGPFLPQQMLHCFLSSKNQPQRTPMP